MVRFSAVLGGAPRQFRGALEGATLTGHHPPRRAAPPPPADSPCGTSNERPLRAGPAPRAAGEPQGPPPRPHRQPDHGHRRPGPRRDGPARRARLQAHDAVRARARHLGRRPGPDPRRGQPGRRHRAARVQPLRETARPQRRDAGGRRRPRLRRPGRRVPLLHLHLYDAACDGGLRRPRPHHGRPRSPEPDRRRRPGRQRAAAGLGVLRRPASPGRAARNDRRRAGPHVQGGAPDRGRPARGPDAGLAAQDGVRRHGPAVGHALPQHAHGGHRVRVPGRLPDRRHESLRGPRHHPAVRAGGRAVDRRLGAGPRPRRRRRSPASPSAPPGSRRRSRNTPASRAAACSST